LIVDIEGPEKRCRFILDKAGDGKSVMDILVDSPSGGNLAQLEKEAKKSLGGPEMEVRLRQEALFSINEEV
jgi:hypothetical protein